MWRDLGKIERPFQLGVFGENRLVFCGVEAVKKTPPAKWFQRRARGEWVGSKHVPDPQGVGENKILEFEQNPYSGSGRSGPFFSSTNQLLKPHREPTPGALLRVPHGAGSEPERSRDSGKIKSRSLGRVLAVPGAKNLTETV